MTEHLDLGDAITLLQAALRQAQELDGAPAISDTRAKENRGAAAEQNRRLQVLTHLCERAGIEVTAVLWGQRGFPDPLKDEGP